MYVCWCVCVHMTNYFERDKIWSSPRRKTFVLQNAIHHINCMQVPCTLTFWIRKGIHLHLLASSVTGNEISFSWLYGDKQQTSTADAAFIDHHIKQVHTVHHFLGVCCTVLHHRSPRQKHVRHLQCLHHHAM